MAGTQPIHEDVASIYRLLSNVDRVMLLATLGNNEMSSKALASTSQTGMPARKFRRDPSEQAVSGVGMCASRTSCPAQAEAGSRTDVVTSTCGGCSNCFFTLH